MPPFTVANCAQVRTSFNIGGVLYAQVTQYVRLTVPLTAVNAAAIGVAVRAPWLTRIAAHVATGVQYASSTVTDIRTLAAPSFTFAYGNPGTGAGEIIPLQCAGLITWYTAINDRRHRGRTYLFGFVEASSTGVGPTTTCLTAINAYGTDLRAGLTAAGFPLVVASRVNATCEDVTSHTGRPAWKTQRRRAS